MRRLGDYGRFLELAALESGKPINLTRISQESGIAVTTIRGFYGVLEDTLLGFSVPPFSRSGRARVLKTPRFVFFDGVEHFLDRYPRLARRGFVVCLAPRPEQLTRRVRAIPWDEL